MLALIFVGQIAAPALSNPTATASGSTTATGTVDTTKGEGTLYYYTSENSSESAATIKASGSSQSVTASGTQNVSVTGLTAETIYYIHYVQDDASSNESNVVSSDAFTPTAASTTKGGYVPPTYVKTRRKKKDESILAQVHEIVAKLEESPIQPAQAVAERVETVKKRVKRVVNLNDYREYQRELKAAQAQITRLNARLDKHLKAARDDEDAALKAIFEVI